MPDSPWSMPRVRRRVGRIWSDEDSRATQSQPDWVSRRVGIPTECPADPLDLPPLISTSARDHWLRRRGRTTNGGTEDELGSTASVPGCTSMAVGTEMETVDTGIQDRPDAAKMDVTHASAGETAGLWMQTIQRSHLSYRTLPKAPITAPSAASHRRLRPLPSQ